MEWRSVLCETNAGSVVLTDIQNALKKAGFHPGTIAPLGHRHLDPARTRFTRRWAHRASGRRLIGVGTSGLLPVDTPVQQDLFDSDTGTGSEKKWEKADQALDDIAKKFGRGTVKRGALVDPKEE